MTRTESRTGRRTPTGAHAPGPGKVLGLYAMMGLVMGGLWVWNAGEPLWEHALKLGLLLFIGAPLLHRVQGRRTSAQPAGGPRLSLPRAVAAKIALVAAALAASRLLRGMEHGDLIVAAGILAVVAGLGPLLHRHLMVSSRPPRHPARTA